MCPVHQDRKTRDNADLVLEILNNLYFFLIDIAKKIQKYMKGSSSEASSQRPFLAWGACLVLYSVSLVLAEL